MSDKRLQTNEHRPRLCHLRRRADFVGYGFNLHCEKNKPGQYIGKVDPNSPAEIAGLREHDRIIEVNYVCVEDQTHKEVVDRIKEGVMRNKTKYPDEVILLVVDEQTDDFYLNNALQITSSDPNVEKMNSEEKSESSAPTKLTNSEYRNVTDFTRPNVVKETRTQTQSSNESDQDNGESNYLTMTPPPAYTQSTQNSNPITTTQQNLYTNTTMNPPVPTNGTSALEMTAAEYRAQLKAKRAQKRDPRRDSAMPMKDKFDFINRL